MDFGDRLSRMARSILRSVWRLVIRRFVVKAAFSRIFDTPYDFHTELNKVLRAIPRIVFGALKRAARAMFRIAVPYARRILVAKCPVRTGRTRASIRVYWDGRRLIVKALPTYWWSNLRGRSRGWATRAFRGLVNGQWFRQNWRVTTERATMNAIAEALGV